jgi:hypothetical protein
MELSVTVFRSADSAAQEDAESVLEILREKGFFGALFDDKSPGVPSGACEVRVEPKDRAQAEALIAANPVEDELAVVDNSHQLDAVTVFRSAGNSTEMEAMSVKALLESNGIEAMIVGDARWPNLPEEVRVTKDHVTRAKRLIEAALASGPAGAAEAESATE